MSRVKCQDYRIVKDSLNGENLHTALRKSCDSDMTSIAWNIIEIMSHIGWERYIEWLHKCWEKQISFSPKRAVASFIKEWSLSWEPIGGTSIILSLAFKHFTDADWESYSGYIEIRCYDEEGK